MVAPGCPEAPLPGSARKPDRQGPEGQPSAQETARECGFLPRHLACGEP